MKPFLLCLLVPLLLAGCSPSQQVAPLPAVPIETEAQLDAEIASHSYPGDSSSRSLYFTVKTVLDVLSAAQGEQTPRVVKDWALERYNTVTMPLHPADIERQKAQRNALGYVIAAADAKLEQLRSKSSAPGLAAIQKNALDEALRYDALPHC